MATQRAYTLRLSGTRTDDAVEREFLWRTHEAVNQGVKTFGNWLLTLRGGISHELVEEPVRTRKGVRAVTPQERLDRRLMLALSWLTVESAQDAPGRYVLARAGNRWATLEVLADVLSGRGLAEAEVSDWVDGCRVTLTAAINDDAVWVNRSAAFDEAAANIGSSLTRDEVWDLLGGLFGDPADYLAMPQVAAESVESEDEQSARVGVTRQKELREPARQWLSSRYGSKKGADFGRIVRVAQVIAEVVGQVKAPVSLREFTEQLCGALAGIEPQPADLEDVRRLLSGPGRKSGVINVLREIAEAQQVTAETATKLARATERELTASRKKKGKKGRRAWADAVLRDVEAACGFRYREDKDHVNEFSVMLDHAARRVSATHSWVKLAEQNRRGFEADAQKMADVPEAARSWLMGFCEDRTRQSGATEPYRIRRRAVEGWEEVAEAWAIGVCAAGEERIAAARQKQADPDIRFGDIQLFEALAAEEAECVWGGAGAPDASILRKYVAATDARHRQARFKVPTYRHPDPLLHPVFCDFGNSRWDVRFSAQKPGTAEDLRAVQLQLFNGQQIAAVGLRWHSKRLPRDLALHQPDAGEDKRVSVTRADRLGRVAGGARPADLVKILGLSEEKYWNGRLQASRRQLSAIAAIRDNRNVPAAERTEKVRQALGRVRWMLTFSVRLQPHGAWLKYATEHGLRSGWPHVEENKKRNGQGQLMLCRLPGLRLLSVDLGLRHAAACAVWEAVSGCEVRAELNAQGQPVEKADGVYLHLPQGGRTVVYRRTGEDAWARLDRSFVIRLPGEEDDVRKASPGELANVQELEKGLGYTQTGQRPKQVDELIRYVLRLLRLGLDRHARRAGIGVGLGSLERVLPGGRRETMTEDQRGESVAAALADWHALASDRRWSDSRAAQIWEAQMAPQLAGEKLPQEEERVSYREREQVREVVLDALRPVARGLQADQLAQLAEQWRTEWLREEVRWRKRLRWVKDWLLPRGSQRQSTSIRHTGGLSLVRLENLRMLYRLEKAYAARLRVDAGGARGEPALLGEQFGQRTLDALERLRENRVKQTASRIVAAALGLDKDLRPGSDEVRFAPCHAVVIENLTHYRPDEVRTRRENRQLMSWCAARVGKHLGELCELYGLMVREVPAAHTSRQDSVTGAPGVRCADVRARAFFQTAGFWERELNTAEKTVQAGTATARSRYLADVGSWLGSMDEGELERLGCIRVPVEGGPVFVSALCQSPAAKGVQADANAAGNIGLRALLDPDWSGRWWYVLCDPRTLKPVAEKVKGSQAVDAETPMPATDLEPQLRNREQPVNLWRDVSAAPLNQGPWTTYSEYREGVMERVTAILRERFRPRVKDAHGDEAF